MSQQYSGGILMVDPNKIWRSLKKGKLAALLVLFIIIFGSAANAQVIKLPETGQTTCYLA
jgi:hypothetical protein